MVFGLIVLMLGGFAAVVAIRILGQFTRSEAYEFAVARIGENDEVRALTGGIAGYGRFPAGRIREVGDHGYADLRIHVKGRERDVSVRIMLDKPAGGAWTVDRLAVL